MSLAVLMLLAYASAAEGLVILSCHGRQNYLKASEVVFKGKIIGSGVTTPEMKADFEKRKGTGVREELPAAYRDYEVLFVYKGVLPGLIRVFSRAPLSRQDAGDLAGDVIVPASQITGVYFERANCAGFDRRRLDEIEATRKGLDELIGIMPGSPGAYMKKIASYELYDDSLNVLSTIDQMVKKIPGISDDAALKLSAGKAYYQLGRDDEAISALSGTGQETAETYRQLILIRQKKLAMLDGAKIRLQGQVLEKVSFSGLDLSGADFSGAKLRDVTFTNVTLTGANFSRAEITGSFIGSDLASASFAGSHFRGALEKSNFAKADFTTSQLQLLAARDNSFVNADFDDSQFTVIGAPEATRGKNRFSGASFRGASIAGNLDFAEANFSGARALRPGQGRGMALPVESGYSLELSGQDLSEAKLDGGNFTGASFKNALLRKSSLRGAILAGADFTGADISGADLSSGAGQRLTKLAGADFSAALNIQEAKFDGAVADCNTKFPKGFDIDTKMVEITDPVCAPAPASGVLWHAPQRYLSGDMDVCGGNFQAPCLLSFLIGETLARPATDSQRRLTAWGDLASALLEAGEKELAMAILYRAFAEYSYLVRAGTGMPQVLVEAFESVGTPVSPHWRATDGASDSRFRRDFTFLDKFVKDTWDLAARGDQPAARKAAAQAITAAMRMRPGEQGAILRKFAPLYLRMEAPLRAETREAFDKKLRETRLPARGSAIAPAVDPIAEGMVLLKASNTAAVPAYPISAAEPRPGEAAPARTPLPAFRPPAGCPDDWSLEKERAHHLALGSYGVLVNNPLAREEALGRGNIISAPVNLRDGRDTFVSQREGYLDLDGVTVISSEILQLENGLPNDVHILATGLSRLSERALELKGDPGIDTVYLDGCLSWDNPKPSANSEKSVVYSARDRYGNTASLTVSPQVKVDRLTPRQITDWIHATEKFRGIPYLPQDENNIKVYQAWLDTVQLPKVREAFSAILAAMKNGQMPTELLSEPPRGADGKFLLSPFYMNGRSSLTALIPEGGSCAGISVPHYYNEVNLITAKGRADFSSCPPGKRAYILSDAQDELNIESGLTTYYTGAGNDKFNLGRRGTDLIVLAKGWGKQVITKECERPAYDNNIVSRVAPPQVFGGLGITFQLTPNGIIVESVLPGKPADRAGLSRGDIISAIDDKPVTRMTKAEILVAIRGSSGTPMGITFTSGVPGRTRSLQIARERITVPSHANNTLQQTPVPIDYKWKYPFRSFIIFGPGIFPVDIEVSKSALKNKKTGDEITFPSGNCFNLVYAEPQTKGVNP